MKRGRLRKDESGHDYVVPVDLVNEFDKLQEEIDEVEETSDKFYELIDKFENNFGDYRVEGDLGTMDIIMEE